MNETFVLPDKTFVLPNYVNDSITTILQHSSFNLLKDNILNSCNEVTDNTDIIGTIKSLISDMPDKISLDDLEPVYAAFRQYCNSLDKDDPEKTVYKPEYYDIKENLEKVQAAIYVLGLKIKFTEGYDYVRVYSSSDILDVKEEMGKFQDDLNCFKDLLHVCYEGVTSGSAGPDEIENALSSLYELYEQITDYGKKIQMEYFS